MINDGIQEWVVQSVRLRDREVELAQILYASDNVSGDIWDARFWPSHASIREKLSWFAVEACLRI